MKIINKRPALFDKTGNVIWTDPYIQKKLLDVHLDPGHDGASRKPETIRKTCDWINSLIKPGSRILDLGCGPGLYAETFAKLGHYVTGVDMNHASLEYAKNKSVQNGSGINYIEGDYIKEFPDGEFDLIMMIYCDMGTHPDHDRDMLLSCCRDSLAVSGIMVFDVFDERMVDYKKEGTNWEYCNGPGFWTDKSHLVLQETFHYPEAMTFAYAFNIITDAVAEYFIIWEKYYDRNSITEVLKKAGFENINFKTGLLEDNDFTSGNAMFVVAGK